MDSDDINPYATEENEAAHAVEEERKRLKREQYLDDLRFVMNDRRGRNVMRELLDRCGVMHGGFIADPFEMQFKAGGRNVGLRTLDDMLEVDSAAYVKMLTEDQK